MAFVCDGFEKFMPVQKTTCVAPIKLPSAVARTTWSAVLRTSVTSTSPTISAPTRPAFRKMPAVSWAGFAEAEMLLVIAAVRRMPQDCRNVAPSISSLSIPASVLASTSVRNARAPYSSPARNNVRFRWKSHLRPKSDARAAKSSTARAERRQTPGPFPCQLSG